MNRIEAFNGLNNQERRHTLPPGTLSACSNVVLYDNGDLETRWGYGAATGLGETDCLGMLHEQYGFYARGGSLYWFDGASSRFVASGVDAKNSWAAVGDDCFYGGATNAGWVRDTHWRPLAMPMPIAPYVTVQPGGTLTAGQYRVCQVWRHIETGMETPASEVLAYGIQDGFSLLVYCEPPTGYVAVVFVSEANNAPLKELGVTSGGNAVYAGQGLGRYLDQWQVNTYTLAGPMAAMGGICALAHYGMEVHAAFYKASSNESMVCRSQKGAYQAYRLGIEVCNFAGRIVQMLGVPEGVLIVTDQAIWLWSDDSSATGQAAKLLRYGAAPKSVHPIGYDSNGNVAVATTRAIVLYSSGQVDDRARVKFQYNTPARADCYLLNYNGAVLALVYTENDGGVPYNAYGWDN